MAQPNSSTVPGWITPVSPQKEYRAGSERPLFIQTIWADSWISGALSSGRPDQIEARLRRFDGQYRWFLFRANPLRDESGRLVRWYGTNVDIEDRKQAEEKLHCSGEVE